MKALGYLVGNASEIVPGVATGSSRQNGREKKECDLLMDENAGVLTNFSPDLCL